MSPSIDPGYMENEQIPGSAASETSDYGSMATSVFLSDLIFTSSHLKFLNHNLSVLEPQDILKWCLITLPGLFQTTAFGLSGLSRHVST